MAIASIVWWYGPYETIGALGAGAQAQGFTLALYMARGANGEIRHVGYTDQATLCFDVEAPQDPCLQNEGNQAFYLGWRIGGGSVAMPATRDALRCVLGLDENNPNDYVSVFSSFFSPQWNNELHDYPPVDPPTGFPILFAFNPIPVPPERNWIMILGTTSLHHAVRDVDAETVGILLAAGADPNARDIDGETPLHHAARDGEAEAVGVLLEAGADWNAGDHDGDTPLYQADVRWGRAEAVRALLTPEDLA